MAEGTILSIDAMGGDAAPGVVVDGVAILLAERPDIAVLLHGDETVLAPLVAAHPALSGRCQLVHSDSVITSDMKPSQALRRGKGSSMWNAVEAVKNGEAGAAVSAGNTGALMAISMLILRKMDGVHRPAMTALWPTMRGRTVVLDVGANLEADAAQLVSFAIMGEAYARAALGIEKPSIGILNIGSEEMKGHDEVREAHEWLREAELDMDYRGFVEGNDISKGAVDVVVTDGFTGNVALKAGEGVARMLGNRMREAFTANIMTKLGAVFASGGLKQLRAQMDPSNVNGGVLLGLGGVSVKSHGGTDARGFAQACLLAADLAASHYQDEIIANLLRIREGGLSAD
tara:strand:+ start:182 stop:1216 length:1035 start_codon:yes stop_codon:yes gene_type:complete